jgi:hypothetical protein
MNLVADPKATLSTPVAFGSNVPQCPTFFTPYNLRSIDTQSIDVIP